MSADTYAKAKAVGKTLADHLDAPYHDAQHVQNVVEAADRLLEELGVAEWRAEYVRLAAWFHDVGHAYGADQHEDVSAEIAADVLTSAGYAESAITRVVTAIRATEWPQSPGDDLVAQVVCDADLWSLGADYETCKERALRYRDEVAPSTPDDEWMQNHEAALMDQHEYVTDAAQSLWGDQKAANLRRIRNNDI